LKIITWNCRNNFKDKAADIILQQPDILIIPECEKFETVAFLHQHPTAKSALWFGENVKKGIGIFSFSGYKIEKLDIYNEAFKYIIPLRVLNDTESFTLLAVWTQIPYVKHLLNAIDYYDKLLDESPTIIAGDFNANTNWDYQSKTFNHTNLVKKLADKNIFSTYHHFCNEKQGDETKMTHQHAATKKSFHIDYCFVSKPILDKLINVEVGLIEKSDHAAITISFQ